MFGFCMMTRATHAARSLGMWFVVTNVFSTAPRVAASVAAAAATSWQTLNKRSRQDATAVMASSSDRQPSGLVGTWLYFAVMESSSWQATLGKKALGLVVTDESGKGTGAPFSAGAAAREDH